MNTNKKRQIHLSLRDPYTTTPITTEHRIRSTINYCNS